MSNLQFCLHALLKYSFFHLFTFRPLGQTFGQYLDSFNIRPQGTGVSFNQPEATDIIRPKTSTEEEIKEKVPLTPAQNLESEISLENSTLSFKMADSEQSPIDENDSVEEKEISSLPARRSYKYDDPPIVFTDVDVCNCFKKYDICILFYIIIGTFSYYKSRRNGSKFAQPTATTTLKRIS